MGESRIIGISLNQFPLPKVKTGEDFVDACIGREKKRAFKGDGVS